MTYKNKLKVLVCPLNWGLGHATRCIPMIEMLCQMPYVEVFVASDGDALSVLQKTFPELPFFELPSYDIRYRYESMVLNMAIQLPKVFNAIKKERLFIEKTEKNHRIDVIISDNRYGCHHPDVKNIFLTHQLSPITPFRKWFTRQHFKLIQVFDECWVPDIAGENNLSGALSHHLPHYFNNIKIQYIGVLSRMKKMDFPKQYDIIAVLSGPEPQRSIFEQKIIESIAKTSYQCLLVRGLPNEQKQLKSNNTKLTIKNYLNSIELNQEIASSKMVVARSGYSTVMDLVKMQKKALLIPTVGQTEQIYLAKHCAKKGVFISQTQNNMEIEKAFELLQNKLDDENKLDIEENLGAFLEKYFQKLLSEKVD